MISLQTSVDDLAGTFRCSLEYHTIEELEDALTREAAGQNRITVIKLLRRAIRLKKLGARHI